MSFRVELDLFQGPLEVLIFLLRRAEVDPAEVSAAQVLDQYLEYLSRCSTVDVASAGEFIALAALLLELKLEGLLPAETDGDSSELEVPQEQLAERLLQYREYRLAALALAERAKEWQRHFPRMAAELHDLEGKEDPQVQDVELWDLVSAFNRIIYEVGLALPESIVYDETPIQVYMQQITARLKKQHRVAFHEFFVRGMSKSTLVSIFLAILELVAEGEALLEQSRLFGEIWLVEAPSVNGAPLPTAPRVD